MIRYILPAAVAALALGAPGAIHAQMAQPMPQTAPKTTTDVSASTPTQPGQFDTGTAAATPSAPPSMPAPLPDGYAPPPMPAPISPRTTWIPGHYNWDPNTSNYVWTSGQYVEAPHENAQWIPGHWVQTPTAWIWMDGRWN
jgi:hypothetical protein